MAREPAEGRLGLSHWFLISDGLKSEWNAGDDAVALRDLQSPARMCGRIVLDQIEDYFCAKFASNSVVLECQAAKFIGLRSILAGDETIVTHGTTYTDHWVAPNYRNFGHLAVQF